MPIPEGQPLQIAKALTERKPDVDDLNMESPETKSLKDWIESQWKHMSRRETLGNPIEVPADWETRLAEERQWVGESMEARRQLAKDTAAAYCQMSRVEAQIRANPTDERFIRTKNANVIAEAQQVINEVQEARGESFPEFVQLGFEYLIGDGVDVQKRVDEYYLSGGEEPDKEEFNEVIWEDEGWQPAWGAAPKLESARLRGQLKKALDARHYVLGGQLASTEAIKQLGKLKATIVTDSGTRADKDSLLAAIDSIITDLSSSGENTGVVEHVSASEYDEVVHGRLPEGLVEEMKPLCKKILVLRGSKEWKEAVQRRDVNGLRKMALRLGTVAEEIVGYEIETDNGWERVQGASFDWEASMGSQLSLLQDEIDKLQLSLGDIQDEPTVKEINGSIALLNEQRDAVRAAWVRSHKAFSTLWGESWARLYDERKFGEIPRGLLEEMIPLYQQLQMTRLRPNEVDLRNPRPAINEARSRLNKVSRWREYCLANWSQLEGEDVVSARIAAEEKANSEQRTLTEQNYEHIDRAARLRWTTSKDALNVLWNKCWNETYVENENQRRDTFDAFIEFAKKRGCFGDFDQLGGQEKVLLESKIARMVKAENPLDDTDNEVKELFIKFQSWLRGWMIGELSDVMESNQNSFISGMTQVSARLQVSGLWGDVPIVTIIGAIGENHPSKGPWKELAGQAMGQLQAMSAIHNRERLYARVKNIHPSEIVKAMVGIAEQSAGRGESLGMDAKSWASLFEMDVVSSKETAERFGETVRRAMAIFLTQDRDRNAGNLMVRDLLEIGISREAIMSLGINPDQQDSLVIENIFPLESKGSEFVEEQKARMIKLIAYQAEEESLEHKAAKLAVGLAFKAMEFGFVGADLDAEASGKEVIYRLLHSRIYRLKYCLQSKEAGNPLTIDSVDRCLLPYFDMIFLPVGNNGESRSLRDWILGRKMRLGNDGRPVLSEQDPLTKRCSVIYDPDRVPAHAIPFRQMSKTPDYIYYDSALKWGNDLWDYLMKGSGVKWLSVVVKMSDEGKEVNPEYVFALREYYKKLGYWLVGFTPMQISTLVFPGDGVEADSFMNVAFSAWYRKETYPNGEVYDDKKFRADVQLAMLRRIAVTFELMPYGIEYNPALQSAFAFRDDIESRINAEDRKAIRTLLTKVSDPGLAKNVARQAGVSEFAGLFPDRIISIIFANAGLIEGTAQVKDWMALFTKIAERAALLKAGRH